MVVTTGTFAPTMSPTSVHNITTRYCEQSLSPKVIVCMGLYSPRAADASGSKLMFSLTFTTPLVTMNCFPAFTLTCNGSLSTRHLK